MHWDQLDLTLGGLKQHYANGDFTPRQLMAYLLTQAKQDTHNSWISVLSEAQLEPYLSVLENTQQAAELPLYGVPFAIKDNIDLAGIDTTAGCEAFRYTPDVSATVVDKLLAAGAIPLGKTNLDQFATGLVGARSPFGGGKNALNPKYVSGGSSAGSAVATATGQVSFALGTDTAGSGRVPAAFNNLVGVKPTRGLLSTRGVVPACRSLDCVSIFALTCDDAEQLLSVAEGFDGDDPYSRQNQFANSSRFYGLPAQPLRIGVPSVSQREFYGDPAASGLFEQALTRLESAGHRLVEVDISPLLAAAKLLYQGPWVAERYVATEALYNSQPDAMLSVIREIISGGQTPTAAEAFKAMYQLQAYRQQSEGLFSAIDSLLLPTAPTCFTHQEVAAEPIVRNSELGTYTNFVNLLDLAAVAAPAGFLPSGVGFGVSFVGPALSDRKLLSLANDFCLRQQLPLGALDKPWPKSAAKPVGHSEQVELVVCGAHLQGQPLNWQLTERGAKLLEATQTAAGYKLYAMADGRPALVRDPEGREIAVEVWRLAASELGSFVAAIPPPLGIGKVELADGSWVTGFIAEPRAVHNSKDISQYGGWRHFLAEH